MKKFLVAVLSIMLLVSMAVGANADTILHEEGSADMLVTLTVPCGFRVVIPDRVAFMTTEKGTEIFASVRAYGINLWNGSKLNITVRSANSWELREDADHYGYSVATEGSKTALKNGDTILSVASGTTFAQQVLDFTLNEDVVTAGEFTDKLTFVLSID